MPDEVIQHCQLNRGGRGREVTNLRRGMGKKEEHAGL